MMYYSVIVTMFFRWLKSCLLKCTARLPTVRRHSLRKARRLLPVSHTVNPSLSFCYPGDVRRSHWCKIRTPTRGHTIQHLRGPSLKKSRHLQSLCRPTILAAPGLITVIDIPITAQEAKNRVMSILGPFRESMHPFRLHRDSVAPSRALNLSRVISQP